MPRLALSVVVVLAGSAPAWGVECTTLVGNLVTPCGFESAPDTAAWTVSIGDAPTFAAGQGENATGAIFINTGFIGQQQPSFSIAMQSPCFPVSGGATYSAGLALRTTTVDDIGCEVSTRHFSDNACANFSGLSAPPFEFLTTSYQTLQHDFTVSATTQSAELRLVCFATQEMDVYADNGFVVAAPSVVAVPTLGGAALAVLIGALALAGLLVLGRSS